MKLFSYLSVAVLLLSSIALAAYSPDLLSALIVGLMCIIALAGCIHGLLPTISITSGLLNGQKSIRKASETEGSSAWVAALQIERFFQQKTLDGLFEEYREKVQHQRETGQIVSDLDEVLNEDVLALHTWKGVIAQLPGTLTGLGIVQGRSTTTFDPKAPITRAQFAAICARFDTGKSNGEQTFSDIQGHWAEKYIQRAAELGWIKGFEDGTFRPDTYITRAQAMTMINRVLNRIPEDESDLLPGMNVWPDCNPGDWFYLAVQEATNSHDFEHKAGNYETWTKLMKNPDWTRYEN